MRRQKQGIYFERIKSAPAPIIVRVKRRIHFNEVDVMGVVWFGRYAALCEEGNAALGKLIGLSYKEYQAAGLRAPIVQFHVDYMRPLFLDEEVTIKARLIWCEGARHNIEYTLIKEDNTIAATAYTVQLFVDDKTFTPCLIAPPALEKIRKRWRKGAI